MPSNVVSVPTIGEKMPALLLPSDPLYGAGLDKNPYQDISPEQLKSSRKTSTILAMRGHSTPFPSGFYSFEEYLPPQKFHEIDSREFAKIYKHDEVEKETTNVSGGAAGESPRTGAPRKLSSTQAPSRRISNNNPAHTLPSRQHSKTERSISTTSNLTVTSPRKTTLLRKTSVPQRLGELKPSDSWCSKKTDNHPRLRINDSRSGTPSKSRKTSDLNFPNMNRYDKSASSKPALWSEIRQAFHQADCESSSSSITLMSDHIVSLTEQPAYSKPNRKTSVRSGPITTCKKSGFASVANYLHSCGPSQRHSKVKSTGKILWHRGVLALNIQHSR
ncbi:hypothetical protein ACHWQZ_G015150 [Mnemiopsis leidyi]